MDVPGLSFTITMRSAFGSLAEHTDTPNRTMHRSSAPLRAGWGRGWRLRDIGAYEKTSIYDLKSLSYRKPDSGIYHNQEQRGKYAHAHE